MTRNLGTKISITLELIKALAVMAILVIGALTLYGSVDTKKRLTDGRSKTGRLVGGLFTGSIEDVLDKVRNTNLRIKARLLKIPLEYVAAPFIFIKQASQTGSINFASLIVKSVQPTLAPPPIS